MSESRYRDVADHLAADPQVTEAKMMGMPSLKLGSTMFAGFWEDELVVKVGRERVAELVAEGIASPFDPSRQGRAMKDWAQIAGDAGDWAALADEAKALAASGS